MPGRPWRRPHHKKGSPVSPGSLKSTNGTKASRYREAADQTIEQLDWVINYLYRIRKPKLARALRENRTRIVKQYRGD